MEETHVVTCFLRNRGDVLLLRRSEDVGSYAGQWSGVAGPAEGNPDDAAREEIREETALADG
jgi:8-oxo-dGTP pyrophosphatase MutT (NUDIX family)